MATDVTRLERSAKPVVNADTVIVRLPANAVGGTAEDLLTDLRALTPVIDNATGILILNNSAADAFLRSAAAGAGEGILIPDNGERYLGWDLFTTGILFLENSGIVDVMIFRS